MLAEDTIKPETDLDQIAAFLSEACGVLRQIGDAELAEQGQVRVIV